ncbi:Uncharacterised protein [Mycobacterium tuberculosis]|nr:Uncharacterised protein [Mycobacterium tuberculosis]
MPHSRTFCQDKGLYSFPQLINVLRRKSLRHSDNASIFSNIPCGNWLISIEFNAISLQIFQVNSFTVTMVCTADKRNL